MQTSKEHKLLQRQDNQCLPKRTMRKNMDK